ncbi:mechanosensitive ion channel domain-containing protein [Actinopolymorpha pittospori]
MSAGWRLAVPIGDLVLGGAVTGVVVGVAAQQTLANVFAGILLLVVRPFSIGEMVQLCSGQLGGPVTGRVLDIGLVYVRMQSDAGPVAVPNSQALNAVVCPPGYQTGTDVPLVPTDQPLGGRQCGG